LGEVVGGEADEEFFSLLDLVEYFPRCRGRKIILSQVDSVGIGRKADVNAVIDNQRRSIQRDSAQFPGTAKKTPYLLRLRFVAQLDQRRACRDQLFRVSNDGRYRVRLSGEAGEVDDGIERW
jgi:hypothetical protein